MNSVIIISGIGALIAFILCLVFGRLYVVEGSIFALCLCIMYGIAFLIAIKIVSNPPLNTIQCVSIEQIDTLYKNDSIIGYEITYIRE